MIEGSILHIEASRQKFWYEKNFGYKYLKYTNNNWKFCSISSRSKSSSLDKWRDWWTKTPKQEQER